jgi:hypothetical protein
MPTVKDNDLILAIRMRELCRPPTAWNRSLWSVSTQTTLMEVLEASMIRRDGILSDASLSDLQATAAVIIGKDPGVGDAKARRYLQPFLSGKTIVTPGSLAAASIESAAKGLDVNYLYRWAAVADLGVKDDVIEQCARSVVSHLLNRGHSPEIVAARIRGAVLSTKSSTSSSGDLIRDLQALASLPMTTYCAVFPVKLAPLSHKTTSKGWMKGADVSKWMKQNSVPPLSPGERITGAVTVDVTARDHIAGANAAAVHFAMIRDRAILGVRKPIDSFGYFWLSGRSEQFPIEPPKRGVEVASIGRPDQIYAIGHASRPNIERAIALLAQLDHGPASAAVTSGWAALESLSMGPAEDGNRVETAIRVAALVTASFARAELTTLAYSYASSNKDQLATDLRDATSNKERAEKMMHRLVAMPLPSFGRVEDMAAAKRMVQLLADPLNTIKRVNQYIEYALKRLYRLRNLVAHGARTDSIVLEAGVRAAAPLIGAAFDRIHHASTSQGLSPVELIARAQLKISLLDPTQPKQLASLLE